MDNREIRSLLVDLVESGDFPDESFDIGHIEKIDNFKVMPDGKIRFGIWRHPHIFGRPTIGVPSSAFTPEYDEYELDPETRQVIFLKTEKEEPVIDYYHLALEDVASTLENLDYSEQFKNLNSQKELIGFAEKEFESIDWMAVYRNYGDRPLDFEQKYLSEIKKQFVEEMLREWKFYKEEV